MAALIALDACLSHTPKAGTLGMPVTNPPVNSVLLRRTTSPSLSDPDLFRVREYAYDPDTRTAALYTPPDSADGGSYLRPITDIVDRWCIDPGVAPYREAQVFHNGTGGITISYVDGVTACMVTCTLGLSLAASVVADGRGAVTATVTGAQGVVLLSINGFQTPGVSPDGAGQYVFGLLHPGTYTVAARETRAGGCSATATIQLVATYGGRYQLDFKDFNDEACRVVVEQREYTDAVEILPEAQPDAVVLDWPGGATDHVFTSLLRGSQCQLALYLTYDEQLLPLFSGDERLHRVRYTRAGNLIWTGFLLPEQYDAVFLAPPTVFNLSATDGLGTLSDIDFLGSAGEALRGDWTLLEVLLFCLNKLSLELPLHTLFNLYPSTATLASSAVEQIRIDVADYADDKNKPWDCGKVLKQLLTSYKARLYQEAGAWWLERIKELGIGELSYETFSALGVRGTPITRSLLHTVDPSQDGRPCWLGGIQRQGLRPAVSKVSVAAEPGDPTNLLRFALPKNTDLPAAIPDAWLQAGNASQLLYQGKDKTPLLRLVGATANAITPERAPWVQLPATTPVPIGTVDGGFSVIPEGGFVSLSFKVKPYNVTPNTGGQAFLSRLNVAISIGGVWVKNNGMESNVPLYEPLYFPDDKEVTFVLDFGRLAQVITQRQAIIVRLVAPVGGATPVTVDISELSLTWENDVVRRQGSAELDDPYTNAYEGETGQYVSRKDDGLTIFHSDTPQARRLGTLLDGLGRPAQGWFEPAFPGQLRELGDYLVRDRIVLQAGPAQALTGRLLGELGPGALLTDPSETRPAVYLLTQATHSAANADWQISAVQLLPLVAPPEELPTGLWLTEDDLAWQMESGPLFILENA